MSWRLATLLDTVSVLDDLAYNLYFFLYLKDVRQSSSKVYWYTTRGEQGKQTATHPTAMAGNPLAQADHPLALLYMRLPDAPTSDVTTLFCCLYLVVHQKTPFIERRAKIYYISTQSHMTANYNTIANFDLASRYEPHPHLYLYHYCTPCIIDNQYTVATSECS